MIASTMNTSRQEVMHGGIDILFVLRAVPFLFTEDMEMSGEIHDAHSWV